MIDMRGSVGVHGIGECFPGEEVLHRLHHRFMPDGADIEPEQAEQDACRMEHAVSPESYEAIKGLAKRKKADGYE